MVGNDSQSNRRTFLRTAGGLAAVGVTGLTGCISDDRDGGAGEGDGEAENETEAGQTDAETTTVIHGAVQGGTTGVLVEAMTDNGFDEEYGIDVQPEYFTSPPKVQQQIVLNEDISTGFMGSIVATRLNAKGHEPRLVGPYMLYHMYVLTRTDGDINRPEDLSGSRISWASKAADAWLKFNVILEDDVGVAPDELEFVETAPPASINLLEKDELDAILLNEPLVTKALANFNFEIVYNPREVWSENQDLPLTTVDLAWDGNWFKENEDAGVALAEASRDTQAYLQENMDSAVETYTDAFGLESQDEIDLAKERLTEVYPTEWNKEAFLESGFDVAKQANNLGLIDAEPTQDIFNWVL